MINTTLYKLNKNGRILIFEVRTGPVGEGHVVITEKGILGGTMQMDSLVVEPKNVGKANETSTGEQADLEAIGKINKLKDKGYKDPGEELSYSDLEDYLLELEGTDVNDRYLPMLAQKDVNKITFPGFLQRKYDGMRAIIKVENGNLMIRSRNGKILENLDHILDDVGGLPIGVELDGELYFHGTSLQNIVSMAKRKQEKNKLIKIRVYDVIMPDTKYIDRKKIVSEIIQDSGESLSFVNTVKVHNWDELNKYFHKWLAAGYEGAMWRDPEMVYEPGRRSWGLIKIKDFEEEEFEIIGVEEATGRDSGTAIFICQTDEGKVFNTRPMGDQNIRRRYLEHFHSEYKGKMLTVRFQSWTDEGKPFHARGVIIRNYE